MTQTTALWAESLGISADPIAPLVQSAEGYTLYSADQVAARALAVQGVVAVACGVDSDAVAEWFKSQGLWSVATGRERAFLEARERSQDAVRHFRWQQEAEWTLLWAIGKVEALGLPTRGCDTRRLVDDILPPLGGEVGGFLTSAVLRSPQALLAEDDRTYRLWCHAVAAYREGTLPADLIWGVLQQRRYAFEWLQGPEEWDDVACDA